MRESPAVRKALYTMLFYFMLLVIVLLTILPFAWMVSSSFKGAEAIRTIPIRWIPERPTIEGYQRVFNMQSFFFPFQPQQPVLAISSTFVAVSSASMAPSYLPSSPLRARQLFAVYLATMMIPGTVTMVPNYIILRILDCWIPIQA